jgi:DNA-binding transcriptional ArsR family regulator
MEIREAIAALSALAQGSRLAIFRLLMGHAPDGVPAGVIAERLGIPPTTLSFHLAQMSHAGLVTSQRESRSIIYKADYVAMQALIAFLTENCCSGEPAACDLAVSEPAIASTEPDEAAKRQ